jgi:hypothetical protein
MSYEGMSNAELAKELTKGITAYAMHPVDTDVLRAAASRLESAAPTREQVAKFVSDIGDLFEDVYHIQRTLRSPCGNFKSRLEELHAALYATPPEATPAAPAEEEKRLAFADLGGKAGR